MESLSLYSKWQMTKLMFMLNTEYILWTTNSAYYPMPLFSLSFCFCFMKRSLFNWMVFVYWNWEGKWCYYKMLILHTETDVDNISPLIIWCLPSTNKIILARVNSFSGIIFCLDDALSCGSCIPLFYCCVFCFLLT